LKIFCGKTAHFGAKSGDSLIGHPAALCTEYTNNESQTLKCDFTNVSKGNVQCYCWGSNCSSLKTQATAG
jgi:hypothetical protein